MVEIRGTYDLLNKTEATIDSIHVATAFGVETRALSFDRPARPELLDDKLGHRIYVLETPLRPGDSLKLAFEVRYDPRGFPFSGIDASVAPNGTFFDDGWLPSVGYQRGREVRSAGERRAQGLTPRPEVPPLDDPVALNHVAGLEPIMFEAVVGTDEGQVAVAPGALRRTWTQDGRRYFHYATDAPILNNYAFFSAAYAVREGRWNDVEIQIFHHPRHAQNVDRMVRSVQRCAATPVREARLDDAPAADDARPLQRASGGHARRASLPARGPVRVEHLPGSRDEAGQSGAGRDGRVAGHARRAGAQGRC